MPEASAELRPPSIKGVLRFWWRALAWSRWGGNPKTIRKEEAALFGAAGDDNAGGQASFLLRVAVEQRPRLLMPRETLRDSDRRDLGEGARYLGYGLMHAFPSSRTGVEAGQLTRPCLYAPLKFTVDLICRRQPSDDLINALKLMGLLGGLGSRTRRGWGSLTLTSLKNDDAEIWQAPRDTSAYKGEMLKILGDAAQFDGEPPYSAFCTRTRIDIVSSGNDPLRLLDCVGKEMLRYRSWGNNGRVLGSESEQNFRQDHDWSKNSSGAAIKHPRRVIFGLPHNYSKKLGVQTKHYDRRASPLLIHVHHVGDGSYMAVLTILRGAFLPENEQLWVWQSRAERPRGNPEDIPPEQLRTPIPDWTVLDAFIERWSKRMGEGPLPIKVLP